MKYNLKFPQSPLSLLLHQAIFHGGAAFSSFSPVPMMRSLFVVPSMRNLIIWRCRAFLPSSHCVLLFLLPDADDSRVGVEKEKRYKMEFQRISVGKKDASGVQNEIKNEENIHKHLGNIFVDQQQRDSASSKQKGIFPTFNAGRFPFFCLLWSCVLFFSPFFTTLLSTSSS